MVERNTRNFKVDMTISGCRDYSRHLDGHAAERKVCDFFRLPQDTLPPRGEHAIISARILQHANVIKIRVSPRHLAGHQALIEGNLQINPTFGHQSIRSSLEDPAMERQSVQTAIQRLQRLVILHTAIE